MKETKTPKKPIIYFYLAGLVLLILFNVFIAPMIENSRVKDVSYSEFLTMVKSGAVAEVEMSDTQIVFKPTDTADKNVYITGLWDDPTLTQTLNDAGVSYTKSITQTTSPLQSFVSGFLLPLLIILALGQLLGQFLMRRVGGPNAMSFGKSNAKVYVEAKTGKTFEDVAGQDEAKGALVEIVDFLHDPAK